ncbi:uncharacterized protein RAG0_12819 [Rhynchosporium agropyri]|uniref:Uncharacterized protein n=1 Tax=Rhynchosporium agropyri TaxID=914238 RepID=A0A1E1L9X9_9HELO|nr:uncharacterized protein RAG0_12819 [Rhynchosporium agropyri]
MIGPALERQPEDDFPDIPSEPARLILDGPEERRDVMTDRESLKDLSILVQAFVLETIHLQAIYNAVRLSKFSPANICTYSASHFRRSALKVIIQHITVARIESRRQLKVVAASDVDGWLHQVMLPICSASHSFLSVETVLTVSTRVFMTLQEKPAFLLAATGDDKMPLAKWFGGKLVEENGVKLYHCIQKLKGKKSSTLVLPCIEFGVTPEEKAYFTQKSN